MNTTSHLPSSTDQEKQISVTYWHKEVRDGEVVMEWRSKLVSECVLNSLKTFSPDMSHAVNDFIRDKA